MTSHWNIVETDHRNVFRYASPAFRQHLHRTDGNQVRRGEHRVEKQTAIEQDFHGGATVALR